jgi:tetratricopeptide (TPR) repeat protein
MLPYSRLANALQRPEVMMREGRGPRTLGRRLRAAACGSALLALAAGGPAAGEQPVLARDGSGSALAREAVVLCLDAAKTAEAERNAMLERGLAAAERAVAADATDAKAHFAVFCNLGRKLENEGASLAGVAHVQRLSDEIDRALALEPAFVDALAAKGTFLIALPALLGGNDDEGLHLIRRAVELAPDYPPARLQLAKALVEQGERAAALAEVRVVLAAADGPTAREASELTAELGS